MAIGWTRVYTQRGQTIAGKRSVRSRISSKDRLPAPTMIAARNSVTGTPARANIAPVSWRERRCCDRSLSGSPRPPR